ncbi:hypothetical protein GCM10027022_07350 [Alpinimonas psychrophila]|uniref:DUF3000 domain-containing protein n=1 Tax=Alpinimonas psychrophila TaxID=748908 RepID=A0A7W3PNL9_9MICO|nr:hypothetical protein [Alpinimonas psychrophila]
MNDPAPLSSLPAAFATACESMEAVVFRSELTVRKIPSPTGVAPHSVALAADVLASPDSSPHSTQDSIHGAGRFILLYDPEEPASWGGAFRVVCFAQAPLENEIALDPFLADVTWSWLVDALDSRGALYKNASGTATRTLSTGFGELADQGDAAQIELRASWSPLEVDMSHQIQAWGELLCMLAGLPPSGEAVSLAAHRRERG